MIIIKFTRKNNNLTMGDRIKELIDKIWKSILLLSKDNY